MKNNVQGASRASSDGLIPATYTGEGQGLDSAFNAGFDDESSDFEPIKGIEPIEPITSLQTVDVADSGLESYTIKKGDSLWSLSKRYGVSVNELYAANGMDKNSVLRIGQQIQIPVDGATATINPVTPEMYQPSGYNQATTSYTVKRGDNLSRIAQQYDTSVRAIKAANGKSSDVIRVGETLIIPVEGMSSSSSTSSSTSATQPTSAALSGPTQTHTVKSGEYPGKIARQYGMTTSELLAINGISDPRKLRVGQELTVSGSGSAANVDSRVETVVSPAPAQAAAVVPAQPTTRTGPTEIRVIKADPLIEGELDEGDSEDIFNNAVEIPVIRLEE